MTKGRIKKLIFSAMLTLLTGCTPLVTTSVWKMYVPTSPDSVRVFEPHEVEPATAEKIGFVSVSNRISDRINTTQCHFDQVLALARKETAKAGGDAFTLTRHELPAPCGRTRTLIEGYMLRLGTLKAKRDTITSDTLTTRVESIRDKGQAPIPATDGNILRTAPENKCTDGRHAVMNHTDLAMPSNMLLAEFGCGWINNKIYLADGSRHRALAGTDYCFEYNHTFKGNDNLGTGILFNSYHRHIATRQAKATFDIRYVGPTLTIALTDQRFITRFGVSMGAGFFDDGVNSVTRFAASFYSRLEYRLTNHIGAHVSFSVTGLDYGSTDENDQRSLSRGTLSGGLQYYF